MKDTIQHVKSKLKTNECDLNAAASRGVFY